MNNERRKSVPLLFPVTAMLKLRAEPGGFCAGVANSDPTGRASTHHYYFFFGGTMRISSTYESLKGKFPDVEGKPVFLLRDLLLASR